MDNKLENFGSKKKIVVIGGGTGTVTVLRGLKKHSNLELTAVVTMTDNGGSTGRLRDEFGMLPVGDVRQCLVALAKEGKTGQLLRDLLLYRFPDTNSDLSGHSFGNIFLTALTQMLGSEENAIEAASQILNVKGKILPISIGNADLVAEYENGNVLSGESNIDEVPEKHDGTLKIKRIWTQPEIEINPQVKIAIEEADCIVIGPGDLYSSLISNLVVKGVKEAISKSKAVFIFIPNLMSKYGQTYNFKLSDFVKEIKKYAGRDPNFILANNKPLPSEALSAYANEKDFPVEDDLNGHSNIIHSDLLNNTIHEQVAGDAVKRSLIRHDSDKLAREILRIL